MTKDWLENVERAREGDPVAFDTLVRRFRHMAVAYAYSLLGDFHLAEDAAQEAFVRAFRDIASLRDVSPRLTTVRLPLEDMGVQAARMALEPHRSGPRVLKVRGEVRLRDSTCPSSRP